MPHKSKGFFTFAQNTENTDYVRLAYALALSLKHSQSNVKNLSIGITPGTTIDPRYAWVFDQIIEIPWGDSALNSEWKLENEWKAYWATPYDETIKLDCDMLFFTDISSWWDKLSSQSNDVIFANTVLNWRGEPISSDFYRKTFTKNKLPNIYTAFGYFRKSTFSHDVFTLAKIIFWNWETFYNEFLEPIERPGYLSTDIVFSIAMKIMDQDKSSYRSIEIPTFTHMKSYIQGWNYDNISEDWREHVVPFFTPTAVCRIGNHRQFYPLHYQLKDFITDNILEIYEDLLKNE